MRHTKTILAAVILLAIAFGVVFSALPDQPYNQPRGNEMQTIATGWKLLRTPATESAATAYDLTATDLCSTTILQSRTVLDATSGMFDVQTRFDGKLVNMVTIAFFSTRTDAANDTFDFELYAWGDSEYAPAEPVYITTGNGCALGTYDCQKHPTAGTTQADGLWVDTISGTDYWDGVTVRNSGNNQICTISFDMRGRRYLYLRTYNEDGTGTEASTIGAIITGY
jgi:hypothetical protein